MLSQKPIPAQSKISGNPIYRQNKKIKTSTKKETVLGERMKEERGSSDEKYQKAKA